VSRAVFWTLAALLSGSVAFGQGALFEDIAASSELIRPFAEKGNPYAQFIMATMLAEIRGAGKNVPEAVKWYERAANQGIAKAQYALAQLFYDGTDVPENYQDAVKWYRLAARQELPDAQFAMANLYREGKAIAKDLRQAAYWFEQAARQNHAEAQSNLGEFYLHGLAGLAQDRVEAYKWFVLAAAQDDNDAIAARSDLRDRMTREQIVDAQRRASAFLSLPPRRNPRLMQQDEEIQKHVREYERVLTGEAGAVAAGY
jgi:TPR repeat protein